MGPGKALFEAPFYRNCRRCLDAEGIVVTQNTVPFLQADVARNAVDKLRRVFADVAVYVAPVPMFLGGYMTFAWASDSAGAREVSVETLAERQREAGIATRYYSPAVHRAAFVLPPYIAELVA